MKRAVSLLLLLAFFGVICAEEDNVVQEGKLRITVLTSRMLRIQFGEDLNDLSGLSDPNGLRDLSALSTRRDDDYLFLETGALTLRYQLGGEILPHETNDQVLRISFRMNNRTVIWYPGKDDALNLKCLRLFGATSLDSCNWNEAERDKLPNGLLSRAGWSVIDLHGQSQSQGQSQSRNIDWLFLGYGHDYETALRDVMATNTPPQPSPQGEGDLKSPLPNRDLSVGNNFAPYLAATATNGAATCYGRSWDVEVLPHETNEECYVRWMQLAAFMPAHETATSDSALMARLQMFDNADALTEALEVQRAMRPYADSVQALGYALCRPMYYDYPEENNAYVYEDQYLFGPDILVAPITRPVQKDGLARRTVWLPPGWWWDVVEERWQKGPQLLKGEYTLRDIPVFWSEQYVEQLDAMQRNKKHINKRKT